jgi:hypothetical protein
MDYSCDSNLLFIDWLPSRLAAMEINKMKYGELGCDTSKKRAHIQTHTTIQPTVAVYSNKTKSTNTHTHRTTPHTRTIKLEIDFAPTRAACWN